MMIITGLLAGIFACMTLKVGDKAPVFTATDIENRVFVLNESVVRGPVILAFFPKAFTSG